MNYFVEVAQVVNGQVASVKVLSRRRERREVAVAAVFALSIFAGAFALTTAAFGLFHRVVFGPAYLSLWVAIGGLAAIVAARRALVRVRRYVIGADIDDDAFASTSLDLVHGGPGGVAMTAAPGMTGLLFGGRAPVALESLVQSGRGTRIPLGTGARVEAVVDSTRFVISVSDGAGMPLSRGPISLKRFARPTLMAMELAVLASLFCAVPTGAALTEMDMRSSIPANATPWEVEKLLRFQAQLQARSLHECFDQLPMLCQRPGYVGVGVSLDKSGEIRSNWIARSTYGSDCPVDQCMSDVVSRWFFEPVPEAIRVILPVQVLRTDKPLPSGPPVAARRSKRLPELAKNTCEGSL